MSNSACKGFWMEEFLTAYDGKSRKELKKEDATKYNTTRNPNLQLIIKNEQLDKFAKKAKECMQETDKAEKSLGDVSSGAVGASVGIGATAGSIFLALKLLPKFKFW